MKTRHGVLSVDEAEHTLLFKGRPVLPNLQGNNSLTIVTRYEIGRNDVVLLQNSGGTACPALFHFVTVAPEGITATPEFCTCSDLFYPSVQQGRIKVAMTGFAGAAEPRATQRKAARTKVAFRVEDGHVSERSSMRK